MKSRLISSHIACGMGKGCSSPCGDEARYLCCWHIIHAATNSVTTFFIPTQYKDWTSFLYVRNTPECPPVGVMWHSTINFGIQEEVADRTSLP